MQSFGSQGKNNKKKWWASDPTYFTSLSGNKVRQQTARSQPASA